MEKISVNELPKYSPWVAQLLGLEPFDRPVRNLAKIDAEYDKDKWGKLLAYYKRKQGGTVQEIRAQEMNLRLKADAICVSREGQLFLTSAHNYLALEDNIIVNALAEFISAATVVVELGSGYGYNFSILNDAYPGRVWIGGEYSQNGLKLANLLFADCDNISFLPFNWYDHSWPIFETIEGKALVFTRESVEQLPRAISVLPTFQKYREKISAVVHLEPVYELIDRESTLGLMRRAYTQLNDYNTDLLSSLKAMGVQILKTQYDVIGRNPLNPTSLIYWQF